MRWRIHAQDRLFQLQIFEPTPVRLGDLLLMYVYARNAGDHDRLQRQKKASHPFGRPAARSAACYTAYVGGSVGAHLCMRPPPSCVTKLGYLILAGSATTAATPRPI